MWRLFDDDRRFLVYGATLGYLTLGFFTDFIAKGRNLYTVLACFILFQFFFVLGFTIAEQIVPEE